MPIESWGVALTPLIVGVVEVAKRAGLPSRLVPLLALALGLGVAGALATRPDVGQVVLWGLALGLSAVGLYSGARAVARDGHTDDD